MHDKLQTLLQEINLEAKLTARFTGRTRFSDSVMDAIAKVDRSAFVSRELKEFAYENSPLSIGQGQTISQPYIVALMTDLLDLTPEHRVLELGTGSGYQTAILATLVHEVYSIERLSSLHHCAALLLRKLGYNNVQLRCANGYQGWQECSPFDAIIVTAAAPAIPKPLTDQLANGGRMVIPVGAAHMPQKLVLLSKDSTGLREEPVLDVSFVPLLDSTSRSSADTSL